jgi:prophage regulatory protein
VRASTALACGHSRASHGRAFTSNQVCNVACAHRVVSLLCNNTSAIEPKRTPTRRQPGRFIDSRPSICRPLYATLRRREKCSCARNCLLCLDQEQSAGASVSMPEPDRIIRLKTVLSRTGLSRSTIYRKITEGTFPAQIRISVNGAGWRESDINRWVANPVAWRPRREFDEPC